MVEYVYMLILLDNGGTKIRIAVSSDGKQIDNHKIIPTPQNYEDALRNIFIEVNKLSSGEKIQGVAAGVRGPMDKEKSILLNPPDLPMWIGKNIKKDLENFFLAPVYLENETALAGLGEATFGAGKGYRIVVYVTVSTGLGGVRIVDGKIDANSMGFEIGHQVIDINSQLACGCGKIGHLEAQVGGASIERYKKEKPENIDDPVFWDSITKSLAYCVNNILTFWSPDVIVMGGSVMNKVQLEDVEKYLKTMTIFPTTPPLKLAELKDISGLYGALAFLGTSLN